MGSVFRLLVCFFDELFPVLRASLLLTDLLQAYHCSSPQERLTLANAVSTDNTTFISYCTKGVQSPVTLSALWNRNLVRWTKNTMKARRFGMIALTGIRNW